MKTIRLFMLILATHSLGAFAGEFQTRCPPGSTRSDCSILPPLPTGRDCHYAEGGTIICFSGRPGSPR